MPADGVMEVVGPHARHAAAAPLDRVQERVQVPVVLGDQVHRAIGDVRRDLPRELREEVLGAVVGERMRGVEAQPIQVVLEQPVQRVVAEESSDVRAAWAIQVDAAAPGRLGPVGEDRRRHPRREVRAVGSEMVVDDVEKDGQAERMRPIDKGPQVVRVPVSVRGREERGAVVPPVPRAWKRRDGHQLDRRHPQVGQRLQPRRDGRERALGRERPDVEFVDHQTMARHAPPRRVGPA